MAILLYDYCELEERASKKLKIWKRLHITIYVILLLAGILNFTCLQSTKALLGDNCPLYPRSLAFRWQQKPNVNFIHLDKKEVSNVAQGDIKGENKTGNSYSKVANNDINIDFNEPLKTNDDEITLEEEKETALSQEENREGTTETILQEINSEPSKIVKRQADLDASVEVHNTPVIIENITHQLMLDIRRSMFVKNSSCQFAEYMPLLSSMVALVWVTLFTMCPGGGRVRSGIRQPWRILAPALFCAFVLVVMTGFSFTATNSGLQAFCAAFHEHTNTTACSPISRFVEQSETSWWGLGGRITAARVSSAAVWAGWACATALLLARCISAPDFALRRTEVYLVSDPEHKITPHLTKSKSPRRSPQRTKDSHSLRSEPTLTSELVTVTLERHPDASSMSTLPSSPEEQELVELKERPRIKDVEHE